MDAAVLKAGHGTTHSFSPIAGSERVPLCGDAFDYNFFAFQLSHFIYTMGAV